MFSATNRKIWYKDSTTKEVKDDRRVIFDEAHYSHNNQPPYDQQLMDMAEEQMSVPPIKLSSKPSTTTPQTPTTPILPRHLIPNLD